MNRKIVVTIGLITVDHIVINRRNSWEYLGSIGGGSAANVYFTLQLLQTPSKIFGIVGDEEEDIKNLALKDLISWNENRNYIYINKNKSTKEFFHQILKTSHSWKHKFSKKSPYSSDTLNSNIQIRKSIFQNNFEKILPTVSLFYIDRISKGLLDLAQKAKNNNSKVIIDLGGISKRYFKQDLIIRAINLADVIQIPKEILLFLRKKADITDFHNINPKIIIWIITDGPNPVIAYHKNVGEIKIEVPKINNLIDSGGAGDAFISILISQLYYEIQSANSLEKLDKTRFVEIINNSIENAKKACLFIGARTYLYYFLENQNLFQEYKQFFFKKIEDIDRFDVSKKFIKKYGNYIPKIKLGLNSITANKEVIEFKKGSNTYETNLFNLPLVIRYAINSYKKTRHSTEKIEINSLLIIIGSGSSYSVAKTIEQLFKPPNKDFSVYAYTPYEYILNVKESFPICIVSHGGSNIDVKACFEKALDNKSKAIYLATGNKNSLLYNKIKILKNGRNLLIDYLKEESGFVGIFSLFTSICLIAMELLQKNWTTQFSTFFSFENLNTIINNQMRVIDSKLKNLNLKFDLSKKYHIVVMGSNWAMPVMIDFESKMVECNLGTTEISELKNYTHGRFMSLYKQPNNKMVLILETPETKKLSNFLEFRLSKIVEVLKLGTSFDGFLGTMDLFLQMFILINQIGKMYKQDPSKPGFPDKAHGLYNWDG